jgi:predicted dehydrogenase
MTARGERVSCPFMSKLRLIQAGVGGMGKAWRTNATGPGKSDDFDLVAMVDVSDAALAEAGAESNVPGDRRFTSLEAALDAVEADAVLTVTPPPVHVQHAELAFARGLHLLTEKPIGHDLAAARRMVELADRAGRQLLVAQNYRYSPPMQKLRALARDEKPVGDLGHGHVDFYIPADFTGSFRESMKYPLLVDMAIHHIDLIRAVTGPNVTKVVHALTFNPTWSWYQHHAGLKMLLELEGGIPFSYSGDWSARGRSTTWNGTWRLQCAEGSIHLEDDKITVARSERWNKNPTQQSIDIPELPLKGQAALLKNFANAIRTNTSAETSGRDNLWSFATVMAAVISSEQRRSVDVAELLATTSI